MCRSVKDGQADDSQWSGCSASRDVRTDMPKLFRRRHAYHTENIAVAVDVMQRRVNVSSSSLSDSIITGLPAPAALSLSLFSVLHSIMFLANNPPPVSLSLG